MVNELIIKGRIVTNILNNDEAIIFELDNKDIFIFYHEQNCCENVRVEQIDGDLNDLIGNPLLMTEEVIETGGDEYSTITWTFYKFATQKGYVDIRWLGESNGYYSESVDWIIKQS